MCFYYNLLIVPYGRKIWQLLCNEENSKKKIKPSPAASTQGSIAQCGKISFLLQILFNISFSCLVTILHCSENRIQLQIIVFNWFHNGLILQSNTKFELSDKNCTFFKNNILYLQIYESQ